MYTSHSVNRLSNPSVCVVQVAWYCFRSMASINSILPFRWLFGMATQSSVWRAMSPGMSIRWAMQSQFKLNARRSHAKRQHALRFQLCACLFFRFKLVALTFLILNQESRSVYCNKYIAVVTASSIFSVWVVYDDSRENTMAICCIYILIRTWITMNW